MEPHVASDPSITAANETTGTGMARTVRVLAAGTLPADRPTRPASAPPPQAPTAPETPVKTRETATDGYHQALTAHGAAWTTAQQHTISKV